MKYFYTILFFLFLPFFAFASDYKLEKVISNLNKPWGMSFIDDDNILVTQKSGDILKINLNTKSILKLEHNLAVTDPHWQAGMLDILYSDGYIYAKRVP